MSDDRGRGAADGGRSRDPDEPRAGSPEDAEARTTADEPEFGSADWLLQQLTGGRPVAAPAESPRGPGAAPEASEPSEPTESSEPAESGPPVPAERTPDDGEAEPAPFEQLLGRPVEEPSRAEEAPAEFPVSFSWNLKPGEGVDPLVEPEPVVGTKPASAATAEVPREAEAEFEPEREPEPDASEEPEPFTPPVRRSNYIEPVTGPAATVPPVDDPVAAGPNRLDELDEPDEPDETAAAGSWIIEPTPPIAPVTEQPEQPEPRTIFDAPAMEGDSPSDDEDRDRSHGLAALLGFGALETDEPSGRSVIGDTTSVIPLDPSFRMPEAVPPAAELPATPAVDATEHAPEDAAETPTRQLDTAEIAALLRTDREEPWTVLPSEPVVPAAEAEVALGGLPSPATSPIDAESIAAASAPLPTQPEPEAEPESPETQPSEEEPDGLARLFGDTIDEPDHDDALVAEPEPEPEEKLEQEPETEAEPEPAAGGEGPQLTETSPFTVPASDTQLERAAYEADAMSAPQANAPTTAVSTATSATAGIASATSATAGSGSAAAPPAPPGLWGSRNNRILFTVVGALAVLLVLIGLFALGTRIPSWFGAAKPAAQPAASTTASAKATPTPTPTPVPTVTPKPAAAVGPGVHPWDSLGGGECIQPFTSVWAEDFTVVDCATPHTAQLVYTNLLSADPAAPYPGADALAQQVPGLCIAGGVVDLGAAGAYPDVQVIGSFPATEQQWKDGQRSYYCFASRVSGQPLTSSVAGPGPG